MPCYVTYKIRTQVKEADLELFKLIAKEQNLRFKVEKSSQITMDKYYTIVTTDSYGVSKAMEELTVRKITKEAKKRNWKVTEVKQVQVKG